MASVFIAGATGVLGRRVVKLLRDQQYHVIGASRSSANDELLKALGATAVRMDLFDENSVMDATAGSDYILHLATAIPKKAKPAREDWALNDRIRTEGTRNLLLASARHRVELYVQQSVTFLYGDQAGVVVDENASTNKDFMDILNSAYEMERLVAEAAASGIPTSVLRFGFFYSEDSDSTVQMMDGLKAGKLPLIGGGSGLWNPIHVDDAAGAVVSVLKKPDVAKGQIYNIVDDQPLTYKEALTYLASTLGAPSPKSVPVWLAKLAAGKDFVRLLSAKTKCANHKAKRELGWRPKYKSYIDGFAAIVK